MAQLASVEPEDCTSVFVEQKSLELKNLIERLERLEEEDEDIRGCIEELKNLWQNMEEIKKERKGGK